MRTATIKPRALVASAIAFGLLAAGCGSADRDAKTTTTNAPTITLTVPPVDTADDRAAPAITNRDDVVSQIVELSSSSAFAGDNSDRSIAAAVAAFNDAGLDFSPDGLATRLAPSCTGLDTQAVSKIIGVDVRAEDFDGFLAASPGYLSCGLYTASPRTWPWPTSTSRRT